MWNNARRPRASCAAAAPRRPGDNRQDLAQTHRDRLPFDARHADDPERVVGKLRNADDWYGVIDCGGNRLAMD